MNYPYSTELLEQLHDQNRWEHVAVVKVSVKDLVPTQEAITFERVQHLLEGGAPEADEYPHVVFYNGCYYVHDGHHRFLLALVRGDSAMNARVVRENRPAKEE